MTQQRRSFKFRILAGDAVSPPDPEQWHDVELRHPPSLAPLGGKPSPQIELLYPKYTDMYRPYTDIDRPHRLAAGSGNIEGIAGTYVTLRAATDRPIVSAWVKSKPEGDFVIEGAYLGLLGSRHLVQTLSFAAGAHTTHGPTFAA